MEEFIARENIKRFKAQLRSADASTQKETLQRLLEAEEEHLAGIRAGNRAIGETAHRTRSPGQG